MRARRAAEALRAAGVEASVLAGGMRGVARRAARDSAGVRPALCARSRSSSPLVLAARPSARGGRACPCRPRTAARSREPLRAAVDIPVFDNSAMDGFAVRFADVADAAPDAPVRLRVVADLPAGTDLDPPLGRRRGRAHHDGLARADRRPTRSCRSRTPRRPRRFARRDLGGRRAPRALGAHIRRRGEDALVGDEVLAAGARPRPAPARRGRGGRASPTSSSSRRPRVAVVSTGSELVAAGRSAAARADPRVEQRAARGARRRGRRRGRAAARASPTRATAPPRASPRRSALGADVVVFSGGVSAGAYEVVKNTLAGDDGVHEGRDAAGQAAGLRRDGRRDAAVRPAGQPRERRRLVRGVRAARAARAAGPHRRCTAPSCALPAADAAGARRPAVASTSPPRSTAPTRHAGPCAPRRPAARARTSPADSPAPRPTRSCAAEVDAVAAGDLVDVMLIS